MTGRRLIGLILVGILRVTLAGAAMAQEAAARPSIAVADVGIASGGWTVPPPELSATVVELLVNELVTSDRFRIYDGQWLVPESEIGRPDLDRLRSAAGERHLDYIVVGSITTFATENKKKRVGGILPIPLVLGGISKQQAQLRVALTFRVVDVRTGEIVATSTGEGVGARRAVGVAAGGLVSRGYPIGAFSSAKLPAARDAMLDEAVRQAVKSAAVALSHAALPAKPRGE